MSFADPPADYDSMVPEGAPGSMIAAAAGGKRAPPQNNPLTPVTIKQLLSEAALDPYSGNKYTLNGKPLAHVEFIGTVKHAVPHPSENNVVMVIEDGSAEITCTKVLEEVNAGAEEIQMYQQLAATSDKYVRVMAKLIEKRANPFNNVAAREVTAFSITPVQDSNVVTWMMMRVMQAKAESVAGMTRSQWERSKSSSGSSASAQPAAAAAAGGFMDRRPSGAQQQAFQQGAYGVRSQQAQMMPAAAAGQQQGYAPQQQQPPQFMQRPAVQQQAPARYPPMQPQQQQSQYFMQQQQQQQQSYQQQPPVRSAPASLQDRMFQQFLQLASLPENVDTGANLNDIAKQFHVSIEQVLELMNSQQAQSVGVYSTVDDVHYKTAN